jgi:hypothetical protein
MQTMKSFFPISIICLILLGCSKEATENAEMEHSQAQHSPDSTNPFIPISPSEVSIIETAEMKDKLRIEAETAGYFEAKNFDKIDDLASQYRASKASTCSGVWKLESVYEGVTPHQTDSEETWNKALSTLHEWVEAKPNSITPRVALANTLVSYAWKARGSGYADSVSNTGWELLKQRLTEAVNVLNEAKNLKEKCPFTAEVMMSAALGLGADKSQYETLFSEAIATYPDFSTYYFEQAYYLTPRWYGKTGDMPAFLQKAADQIGGDDGDLLYARVAWYVDLMTRDVFDDPALSWARVDRGFAVMEKRFPDSVYARNGRAYMAVMGSDKINAPRRLVGALRGKIDLTTWTSTDNFLRLAKQYTAN